MSPDVTIREYYLQFIDNARKDVIKYKNKIKEYTDNRDEVYNYINENKDIIINLFKIHIDNYIEYKTKEYNPKENLFNAANNRLYVTNDKYKPLLFNIIKYCRILHNIHNCQRLIILAEQRQNLKKSKYKRYIADFYTRVHKCVLDGLGYKYAYGLGTFVINKWTTTRTTKMIDFNETNKRKKELLAEGKRLYNDKEAAWYKLRNIPYDGVDYRVYINNSTVYDITFINCSLFGYRSMDYQRAEYVPIKYKGMGYKAMAEQLCFNEEDIFNLQVDIRYKLNIYLYKYPTRYINFVRNGKEEKRVTRQSYS